MPELYCLLILKLLSSNKYRNSNWIVFWSILCWYNKMSQVRYGCCYRRTTEHDYNACVLVKDMEMNHSALLPMSNHLYSGILLTILVSIILDSECSHVQTFYEADQVTATHASSEICVLTCGNIQGHGVPNFLL